MYETLEKIKAIAQEVSKELGYEIFELTYKRVRGKHELKISIDKRKDNISLADCERFSKTIGARLDTEDIIPDSYNLVVESPGAERELRSKKDFERFTGENVKLLLKDPVEKRMVLIGKLKTLEEETVVIKERDTGKDFKTKLDNIKKANLRLEL